jgi:hypothetical protein
MISKIDTEEGRFPLVYAVMHDGRFVEGSEPFNLRDAHNANFIVILKRGQFEVWKDRENERGILPFELIWKRIEYYVELGRRTGKNRYPAKRCANCGWLETSSNCCFFRS